MRFAVFYSDDGRLRGGHFRLYTGTPDDIDFDDEYGVVQTEGGGLSVAFYQNAREFEFCGAGALCLAAVHAESREPIPVAHPSHPFYIRREQGRPLVELSLTSPLSGEAGGGCRFPEQGVELIPQASAHALMQVQPVLASEGDTRVYVYHDPQSAHIEFRYFTAFNDKGEDQATGSVFRYLAGVPLREDVWYTVVQASAGGAEMRCRKQGDRLWYTGNVKPLA